MKFLIIILISSLLFTGCKSTQSVYNIRNYPLPTYITKYSSLDSIENDIVQGGNNAGWRMSRKGEQTIIGYYSDSDKQAMVRIKFSKNDYSIAYLNSSNFNFDGNEIDKEYNELIIKLARSINNQLNIIANKIMFEKSDIYIKRIPAESGKAAPKEL